MTTHLPQGITPDELHDAVRDRYSAVADAPTGAHGFPVGRAFAEAVGYPATLLATMPSDAADAFAGVACPVPYAALQPGEAVLDLGCGAGLDSLYAAQQVGPSGRVIGIDFAPAMVARAHTSTTAAGLATIIDSRVSDGTALPLATASIDAVLVNGIFNLNPAKDAVLAEVARVLKPSGRLVAAEIILTAPLPPGEGDRLDDWFR
jgi:arsenite methyltransferase